MRKKIGKPLTHEDVVKAAEAGDKAFEEYVKQEFDKMLKDYDKVHDVLWGALENLTDVKLEGFK